MSFLSKCGRCKKRKLIVKKRIYKIDGGVVITSQHELCRKCYKGIKKILD